MCVSSIQYPVSRLKLTAVDHGYGQYRYSLPGSTHRRLPTWRTSLLKLHVLASGMQPTRPRGNSSGAVPVGVSIQSRPRTGSRRRREGREEDGTKRQRGFVLNHQSLCLALLLTPSCPRVCLGAISRGCSALAGANQCSISAGSAHHVRYYYRHPS